MAETFSDIDKHGSKIFLLECPQRGDTMENNSPGIEKRTWAVPVPEVHRHHFDNGKTTTSSLNRPRPISYQINSKS